MIDRGTLIADLQRVAGAVDGVPSANDYREHGNHGVSTLYREFGSFTAARKAADIDGDVKTGPTREELIADLRRVNDQLQGTVSTDEYNELGEHSHSTLADRFGGMVEARDAAGIDGNPNTEPRLSEEQLINDIREVAETLGEPPSEEQYLKYGSHAVRTLQKRFGSFTNARDAAGFEGVDKRSEHGRIDREELLAAIRDLAEELGRPPKLKEMAAQGRHGTKTYYDRFGNWNTAIREAGYEPEYLRDGHRVEYTCANCGDTVRDTPSNAPDEDEVGYCDRSCMYAAFKKRYSEEDNPNWQGGKVDIECEYCGETIRRKPAECENRDHIFCNTDCYGKWRSENVVGHNHPRYKHGGERLRYGPNFQQQRQRRMKIDDYRCVICGMTNEESKATYGCELDAHHIVSVAEFHERADGDSPDFEAMNHISNLRMMCRSCHQEWEGIPVVPP